MRRLHPYDAARRMIVLTVNSGSTSVKLGAYELRAGSEPRCIAREHHQTAQVDTPALLSSLVAQWRPNAVAHRVVHGGTRFTGPTRIDSEVLSELERLAELAPLHNPIAVSWIEAARQVCAPEVAQIAAFDTAFFAHLPAVAGQYALAPHFGTEHGVRRYGFHGLAHAALLRRWQQLHPELPAGGRLITLQLGGGCSITAIAAGEPLDTSMGFSPLEGLVMATRSGDIDPAVVPYLQQRLRQSAADIVAGLNRDAGLAGLSGGTRDVSALLSSPDPRARFALDLYCYRARKYIGSYLAVLGGCDGIVFSGGVGEHVPAVRARILQGMQWAGIELDRAANEACRGQEGRIAAPPSRVAVQVIPADEDRMLTAAVLQVLNERA
jgi:acetate kinase